MPWAHEIFESTVVSLAPRLAFPSLQMHGVRGTTGYGSRALRLPLALPRGASEVRVSSSLLKMPKSA